MIPGESDVFGSSRMQVDDDELAVPNPSTPPRLTSPEDESAINAMERACNHLRRFVTSASVDESVSDENLSMIWSFVYAGLTQAKQRRVAEFQCFRDNVERKGKKQFLELVRDVVRNNTWQDFVLNEIFRLPKSNMNGQVFWNENRYMNYQKLAKAYNHPFRGEAVTKFITHLALTDAEEQGNMTCPIYAKAIPVVQSSGTGKSRMLTEVGRKIFTLPICLRNGNDPGYPPSDLTVVEFFSDLSKDNDQSFTAHLAIACFLAAAHELMYNYLKSAQGKQQDLLAYWNGIMEPEGARDNRDHFFAQVVKRAIDLKKTNEYLRKKVGDSPDSKARDPQTYPTPPFAKRCYDAITKRSTAELMAFLSTVKGGALCVTYFDEAHELEASFWVLLRLLQNQASNIKMWYTFMGTKPSFSYYSPSHPNVLSLKLKTEMNRLLSPYIALGFDQHMIAESKEEKTITMGELQTIEHLAKYGRPLWRAHLPEEQTNEIIDLASRKLTNTASFRAKDRDHVFAVLSPRFCLDPLLAGAEAVQLADRSVAHHMRLLTGFSPKHEIFYTNSPSEPILVLGAVDILYNPNAKENRLQGALHTLSVDLCSAGLVEKGVMGELAARILLLVARDFASPEGIRGPNLLRPISLLGFLHVLFGHDKWAGSNQDAFNKAFKDAHINFTHWLVTKDPMPKVPDRDLLANLWARGAALQCCFTQEAIDFVIPIYFGKMDASAKFDPSYLSVIAGHVKFNATGDSKAESALRPIGIPCDVEEPLPYLALLMELGNESDYQETRSKLKSMTPGSPLIPGIFQCLTNGVAVCEGWLANQSTSGDHEGIKIKQLQEDVEQMQRAIDSCNRFSLSVRGSCKTVYGILTTADIADEFQTLLNVTMPPPRDQDDEIQHMRPCERLGVASEHIAWMSKYRV